MRTLDLTNLDEIDILHVPSGALRPSLTDEVWCPADTTEQAEPMKACSCPLALIP